jgi:uncharacterized protein YgiM (DUF1202 family)
MKTKSWLFLFALLSTGLLAQQQTNQAPPAAGTAPATAAVTNTAPATPAQKAGAPASKSETKKAKKANAAAKKKAPVIELKSEPLVAGPAVVVASNVNVRGQAKLNSEIVGRLNKGQSVMVLDEVTLKNSATNEPSAWAKILLPPGVHVWVHNSFVNASNKTVIPRKLNVRGGAGENYSVLGSLKRGDAVKEVSTKNDWIEIEPPSDAYAFVAAQYLKQEPPGTIAAATIPPSEPAPTPETVTEPTTVAAVPADPTVPPATEPAATNTAAATPTPEPVLNEPPPKRVVQREGVVRGTMSIQAPTHFELASPENGRTINYLYTTSAGLDLKRYKGLRIVVTGEEGLDERWRNTPVITIQKIQVVE